MPLFQILEALPIYGPPAIASPAEFGRLGRQGTVVRFDTPNGSSWIGNFAPGIALLHQAIAHPDGRRVLVIAAGALYEVDPLHAQSYPELLCCVTDVHSIPNSQSYVFEINLTEFLRFGPLGPEWTTKRLSWDGFRSVRVEQNQLLGEAWCAPGDLFLPFTVDLDSGFSTGGAYD